ncbi:hypothetical protein GCM10009828_058330 [Actinoplanes couchii]|uniref:Uncharacterized protein n=1 Tax=Actinoplanes couchii TaxID=403638 RepID=A0ABQ3XT35_9ACTN|nr:hypothetical protein Aco03nite_100860 [Actinoplanes couchii]
MPHRHFPYDECPIRADNHDIPESTLPAERWKDRSESVRKPLTGHQPMPVDILFGEAGVPDRGGYGREVLSDSGAGDFDAAAAAPTLFRESDGCPEVPANVTNHTDLIDGVPTELRGRLRRMLNWGISPDC